MVDADHHNNLNIKGSPAKRFFVNDYKSNIFLGRADDGMWDCHFVVKTGGGNQPPVPEQSQ